MAIEITQLLHAGIRIGPDDADVAKAEDFYQGFLGLQRDGVRPHIPTVPGFWVNVKDDDRGQQIHIMGAEGDVQGGALRKARPDPPPSRLRGARP